MATVRFRGKAKTEWLKRNKQRLLTLDRDDDKYIHKLEFRGARRKKCRGVQVRLMCFGPGYGMFFNVREYGNSWPATYAAAAAYRELAFAQLPKKFPSKEQFTEHLLRAVK